MIKVIYTHKLTNKTEESVYADSTAQLTWENAHPILLTDYTKSEPVDVTEDYQNAAEDAIREIEFAACRTVLKRLGTMNKNKEAGIVATILAAPAMVQIALALLLGAPKTARDAIQAISTDLYSAEEKNKVIPILNAVIPVED